MTILSRALAALACFGTLPAQQVWVEPRPKPFDPVADCRHGAVTLQNADPALVAWAAEQRAAAPGDREAAIADLLAALRRMRATRSDANDRAVVHLLHALQALDAELPAAELLTPLPEAAATVRIALLLRAASPTGGELLQTFQQLDPTRDANWEALGGALATRRHRTFAIELHAGYAPRLRVWVGTPGYPPPPPPEEHRPEPEPAGFPPLPSHHWRRDRRGLLELGCERLPRPRLAAALAATPDPVEVDCARLRWLCMMAGLADPVRDSQACVLRLKEHEVPRFAEKVAGAEQRLAALLVQIDDGLRREGLLPADFRRRLPAAEVEIGDFRQESRRQAAPLPPRK